ncbi:hypothetical protein [Desulfosporosinus sp. OT]|uniref:hypothetical protein n=1 Tax=Desulfosporosinus sp. OT TaxID=913865 RepID=UPI000223AAE1|nr:hypothetical protein [Desulfosporosinus sp. OT]EGW37624.1 hypothetical protein DOT_4470 [Desulfosporosinus sp. OT]
MPLKPMRIYSEQWSPSEEQIKSLFPINDIISEVGKDPGIKVFTDDEIRLKFPAQYNISVQARAYNQSLVELLHEYYEDYRYKPELAELLGVQLPQIMWVDTLGLEENLISLHITKLNKQEVFINDIILVKNIEFDSLSDGILDEVLNNLRRFAKDQGAKYLSGYAANKSTLELFKAKGFKEDKREGMGNDYLWGIAVVMGEQLPFYVEL